MNPPPIDPYAGKRKRMAWLILVGVLGWQLLFLLVMILGKAMFPTASKDVIAVVGFAASIVFAFMCMFTSLKWQQEHPFEKKRAAPLDFSQFALAPTDARLQSKNDQDKAKFVVSVILIVGYIVMLARELWSAVPNVRAINSFYVVLILLIVMGVGALRRLRRYPLRFEALADAEGLTIRRMRRQPQHLVWHEIQEASLVEEFADTGVRSSLSLVLLSVNDGKPVASIPLSSFKAEDAARFQSVVARYLKPPSAF